MFGLNKKVKDGQRTQKKNVIKDVYADMYDYTTKENRETIVERLQAHAINEKSSYEKKWNEYNDYYNGIHTAADELHSKFVNMAGNEGLGFVPAVCQEPYIQVESQLIPEVPDFQFYGRDDDQDSEKAKQREYVVKYVMQMNDFAQKNMRNERRLGKYGNSFIKVYWDSGKCENGDIVVKDVDPSAIFPDPDCDVFEDCQYVNYVYPLHINVAANIFKKQMEEQELTISDLLSVTDDSDIYANARESHNEYSIRIIEHWFKQPKDGNGQMLWTDDEGNSHDTIDYKAGDIACVILANGNEMVYIPKYWVRTGSQNKGFPFVHMYRIADTNCLWGISEMEHTIPYTDAIDRELMFAQLNRAYMANDMIIVEEDALSDDSAISNAPGAIITVRANKSSGVKRLGGLNTAIQNFQNNEYFQNEISRTTANYDSNRGQEPARVTTASGISMLNESANRQKTIKNADKISGFDRLYTLVDWTALEFYDDDRMIFIGAIDEDVRKQEAENTIGSMPANIDATKGSIYFQFNTKNMRRIKHPSEFEWVYDEQGKPILDEYGNPKREALKDAEYYYPKVDAHVESSAGTTKSTAYILSALENLMNKPLDNVNIVIASAFIKYLDLPQSNELVKDLEKRQQEAQEQMLAMQQQQLAAQSQKDSPFKQQAGSGMPASDAAAVDSSSNAQTLGAMSQASSSF